MKHGGGSLGIINSQVRTYNKSRTSVRFTIFLLLFLPERSAFSFILRVLLFAASTRRILPVFPPRKYSTLVSSAGGIHGNTRIVSCLFSCGFHRSSKRATSSCSREMCTGWTRWTASMTPTFCTARRFTGSRFWAWLSTSNQEQRRCSADTVRGVASAAFLII